MQIIIFIEQCEINFFLSSLSCSLDLMQGQRKRKTLRSHLKIKTMRKRKRIFFALSSFEFHSFPWFYQTSFTTPGGNETTTNSVLTDDSLDSDGDAFFWGALFSCMSRSVGSTIQQLERFSRKDVDPATDALGFRVSLI